jgi:hypothetical protein
MPSLKSAAHGGVYSLIVIGTIPVLAIGVAAVLALFAYAVLEELADSTTGSAPLNESEARETARRLALGREP